MVRSFKLEDLDCANCAMKMENAIRKLDGVESVSVNFMAAKLTLEAADDRFDEVLRQAAKTAKRIEPDCHICI